MSDLLITRRVVFSECGLFRYLLEHDFGGNGPVISLTMVNPSDADGEKNDSTMTKVDGFAMRMGASKVIVSNKNALIAKDVRGCPYCLKPVGYVGRFYAWLFGAGIHQCDFLNVDTEANRIRERVASAEADIVRLVQEKMDMWERAFAAEDALIVARRKAFETSIEIVELECRNMKASLPKRLQTPLILGGNIIAKIKQRYQSVDNIVGDRG